MRRIGIVAIGLSACVVPEVSVGAALDHTEEHTTRFCHDGSRRVDVLFVIDDSASMAKEAVTLATSLARMGEIFAQLRQLPIDLRIAVTRADACADDPGALLEQSCRARQGDFRSAAGPERASDLAASACTDVCALSEIPRLPTTVAGSTATAVRPWLQWGSATNLAAGIELGDALPCLGSVGVSGCGPDLLGALENAILNTTDTSNPAYGFLRPDASLFVILVTDTDIDPVEIAPVTDLLTAVEASKQAIDPGAAVWLATIGGTACWSPFGDAVAAPSLVELVEAWSRPRDATLVSACDDDYSVVLVPLAETIRDVIRPHCIDTCVADAAPDCTVVRSETATSPDGLVVTEALVAPCDRDPAGDPVLPAGAESCAVLLRDDEISEACHYHGWNVELRLLSAPSTLPVPPTCIEVTCEVSRNPAVDCPNLP